MIPGRMKFERSVSAMGPEQNFIFKDPYKSVTLQKKERVEFGDVSYTMREEPDRYAENISYYAKGVNPSVSVDYGGMGSSSTSAAGFQGRSPYVVNRDGAFRFPIRTREETWDALSRMPRLNTAVNPSVNVPSQVTQINNNKYIDKQLLQGAIRPSAQYNVGTVAIDSIGNQILDPVQYTVGTNAGMAGLGRIEQAPITLDRETLQQSYDARAVGYTQYAENGTKELSKELLQAHTGTGVNVKSDIQGGNHADKHLHKNIQARTTSTGAILRGDIGGGQHGDRYLNRETLSGGGSSTNRVMPGNYADSEHSGVNKGIIIRSNVAVTSGLGGGVLPTLTISNMDTNSLSRQIKDKPLISYLTPNFNVAIKDEMSGKVSGVDLSKQEKFRITGIVDINLPTDVTTRTGQHIQLKDYEWQVYQVAPNMPSTLVLIPHTPEHRMRENPNIAFTTGANMKFTKNPDVLAPMLDKVRPNYSLRSNIISPLNRYDDNRDVPLHEKISAGNYEILADVPSSDRIEYPINLEGPKTKLRQQMQKQIRW
jgi:hypothetical protein